MPSEILLNRGKVATVDDEDYEWLNQWKWHVDAQGYVIRRIRFAKGIQKTVRMHRVILDAPEGKLVDHINGDTLDNRRSNLRLCNHAQNQQNRTPKANTASRFKGVVWRRRKTFDGVWVAKINMNGKRENLGCFVAEEEAARAYDRAAIFAFGEFAKTNFPKEDYKNDQYEEKPSIDNLICENCGIQFSPSTKRYRRFCSKRCSDLLNSRKAYQRNREALAIKRRNKKENNE